MSVSVSLAEPDAQTVLCIRTCFCACRPERQMLLDELPVPMHELDLVRLAELSRRLPLARRCSHCGRKTTAEYRIAAVVPEERSLRALVHVRKDGEQAYGLVEHAGSADPEAAAIAIFRSFPDAERRQQLPADEDALIASWGRPLSTQALVRARFADFLASGKAARIVGWGDRTAYLFARRDTQDLPTLADVAAFLTPRWNVTADAVLAIPAEEGRGHSGSLIECLGPAGSGLRTASITCLANTAAFQRLTEEALADSDLAWTPQTTSTGARVYRTGLGNLEAELTVAHVARSALLYCRTPTEAATLETRRTLLKLAATQIMKQATGEPEPLCGAASDAAA